MPKSIYVQFLSEQPDASIHYLTRLVKILNHFISIEPEDKPKGFECHHIVPRSWKPEWVKEPNNLLKVPTKAHYVIHHLMWKAFPKDHAMQRSFWFFCNNDKRQKITAKVFENAKKDLKHSNETKQKMSVSKIGENHHFHGKQLSEEHKRKLSESQKGRPTGRTAWNKGIPSSDETKRKQSDQRNGKKRGPYTPQSEESRLKSGKRRGRVPGTTMSEESKKKMSETKRKRQSLHSDTPHDLR